MEIEQCSGVKEDKKGVEVLKFLEILNNEGVYRILEHDRILGGRIIVVSDNRGHTIALYYRKGILEMAQKDSWCNAKFIRSDETVKMEVS